MIERNLGNAERLVRLVLGTLMFSWLYAQGSLNPVDWFVALVAIALVLNGIFSRCYLWYVLEVDTCRGDDECSQPGSTCP